MIRCFKNSNSPPAPLGIFETENQTFLNNDKKRKSLLCNKNKEKIDLLLTVAPCCTLAIAWVAQHSICSLLIALHSPIFCSTALHKTSYMVNVR